MGLRIEGRKLRIENFKEPNCFEKIYFGFQEDGSMENFTASRCYLRRKSNIQCKKSFHVQFLIVE